MGNFLVRRPEARKAAYHVRVVPKTAIKTVAEISDPRGFGIEALTTIQYLAREHTPQGFRVVMRVGELGGQQQGSRLAIDLIGGEVLRSILRKDFNVSITPAPTNVNERPDEKCVFDKLISGAIPETPVFNADGVYVTRPKAPDAREHLLFLPTTHVRDLSQVNDPRIFGDLFAKIVDFAKTSSFAGGFQLISNNGPWGLQAVQHLHFHMLGKELLDSPFWQDWI